MEGKFNGPVFGDLKKNLDDKKIDTLAKELNIDFNNFDFKLLKKIPEQYHKKIAIKLIESGQGKSVAKYLSNFQGLDQEIAMKLIESGKGESVAKYLNNFQGLDHNDIAKRIIDQTTPNMIQRISGVFERKPLILKEI